MREGLDIFVDEALPEMDPVIAYEETDYGWRGLTQEGAILEVRSSNDHKAKVPESIVVAHAGKAIGRRKVSNDQFINIGDYLIHFNRAVELYRNNNLSDALIEVETAYAIAPTLRMKFNRAMILLAAGRWKEGFAEYWECEQSKPFMRPQVEEALARGLRPWRGEPYKRLLVLHAHGFGDTIMCLRYVRQLKDVITVVPPELHELAEQCGPVSSEMIDADFFCPILHLPALLGVTPESVTGEPYLKRFVTLSRPNRPRRIGIAWSIGKPSHGDYPRTIPLDQLVDFLSSDTWVGELHSVQMQGTVEAERYGVIPHTFKNFTECAALMCEMDEIVSVDTAALHLAGAIGHRNVYGLLSHWASWRWQARWYNNVRLLRQPKPDDWDGALRQRHEMK